jgi:hypothetical protein
MQCKFKEAWVGQCKDEADESGFCEKHKKEKCCSCDAQATHSCEETGMFVCGAPLCDNCEHSIFPDGCNGGVGFNEHPTPEGMKRHCKKTEQKYTPWYTRESKVEHNSNIPE